jgi:Protein of unknown function (DUF1559)
MSLLAILLIVGGGVAMLLVICGGMALMPFLPTFLAAREHDRQTQCQNNLRQIGLALQSYHQVYKSYPPAWVADGKGRPVHSWRVLILPHLDQADLYSRYDFSEPWNGPNNIKLAMQMPEVFACPSHSGQSKPFTSYAAIFGKECVFRGAEPVAVSDIRDPAGTTLVLGEVLRVNLHWMEPTEILVEAHSLVGAPDGFASHHPVGVHFLMADGSVHVLKRLMSSVVFRNMTTRAGGEPPGDF